MTKLLGRAVAPLGLILALVLVWHEDPRAVFTLLHAAGPGLVLAAVVHVLPMLANARDWQTLISGARRPNLAAMLRLVWIRESVNSLLPVARIGGEVVSFRLLNRWGVRPSTAAASLVVDMQLTLISQLVFTLVGIAFLLGHATPGERQLGINLMWGLAVLAPLLAGFALVQHVSPFEKLGRLFNRLTSGQISALAGPSIRIDQSIKLIWRKRGVVLRYVFFWQPVQCIATSFEIWLALYFLGTKISFTEAVVIESLIQALSSAAFFVPGALGVQEGGFVLIGSALGLDPSLSLALAGARRLRDLLVFVPGLFAWQIALARKHVPGGVDPSENEPRAENDKFQHGHSA
jgi:glycosyltransferase 2 family protein